MYRCALRTTKIANAPVNGWSKSGVMSLGTSIHLRQHRARCQPPYDQVRSDLTHLSITTCQRHTDTMRCDTSESTFYHGTHLPTSFSSSDQADSLTWCSVLVNGRS